MTRYETMDLTTEHLGDLIADCTEGIKTLGSGSRVVPIVDDEAGIIAYALSHENADAICAALNEGNKCFAEKAKEGRR